MIKASKIKLSEADLIIAVRNHERKAIEALYDRYSPALYGIICRIIPQQETAEDILQETFVKICSSISSFNAQKGHFFTWMANIARNLSIDKIRSNDYPDIKNQEVENSVNTIDDQHNRVCHTGIIGAQEMIDKFSPEQKRVLYLIYFKGYTPTEVAKELGINICMLKLKIRKAVLMMRKYNIKE